MEVAKRIKESYSYVCPDIVKEFRKYELEGDKWIKRADFVHSVTQKVNILYIYQPRCVFWITLMTIALLCRCWV